MESTKRSRKDVYAIITDRIIGLLDKGVIPWQRTWKGAQGLPKNLLSNKPYRGVNVWLLAAQGYESPYWLTFKQAKQLGGSVTKGQKGTPVVFWKIIEKDEVKDGEVKKTKVFFLRYYTVFNLEQTEDVRIPKGRITDDEDDTINGDVLGDAGAFERAEATFESYVTREGIGVDYGGTRACYNPKLDKIRIPKREDFVSAESFASVKFHEATHSTGTEKRCNRPGITEFDFHASHQYAEEELVAEFGASFLCSVHGIERDDVIENSAAYIANWKQRLTDDPKIVVNAAQRAQKAADFILGESFDVETASEKREEVTA